LLRFSGDLSQLAEPTSAHHFDDDGSFQISVGPLSLEHAALIDSMWTYHAPHTLSIMQHIIASGNSRAVFVGAKPVSWVLRTAYGSIGMLHTLKDFRRRGYAAIVVRSLSMKIIQDDGVPFCHIVEGNTSSLALFRGLGFEEPYPCERFDWYHLNRQAD
jgi:ribosomal protein S18 acetylase RimI-like enzyme